MYWDSLIVCRRGKYRAVSDTIGYFAFKSKLAYDKEICTVGPPAVESAIIKVKLRFYDKILWWRVSLTQYVSAVKFHVSPSVSSNY